MTDILLRLLVAVLVYWLGEKILGLVGGKLAEILNIVLIIAVVLYVVFGAIWPIIR